MAPQKIEKYFCTICWRPCHTNIKQSSYCSVHNQLADDGKEYKRRYRLLSNIALDEKQDSSPKDVIPRLVAKHSPHEKLMKNVVSNANIETGAEWENRVETIIELCAQDLKDTAASAKGIECSSYNSFNSWISAVIRSLDNEDPNSSADSFNTLAERMAPPETTSFLIHLLTRYEIEAKIRVLGRRRRGPPIGSTLSQIDIYGELLTALKNRETSGITVNLSEIARKYGISRQAVSKKWRKVIESPKDYRKAYREYKKTTK